MTIDRYNQGERAEEHVTRGHQSSGVVAAAHPVGGICVLAVTEPRKNICGAEAMQSAWGRCEVFFYFECVRFST